MTDEMGYVSAGQELFRWDKDGKLVFIHPALVFELNKHIEVHTAEQSALIQQLTVQVAELQTRVAALEADGPVLTGFGEVLPRPAVYVPFGSTAKLVEQVESMFDCRDGDYRAWHTQIRGDGTVQQYNYAILGIIAPDTIPDAQERLRQVLYSAFHKLKLSCKSERPVLYWRYAKTERIQEDSECSPMSGNTRYKIMTRIAIPEADFSAVAEVVKADDAPYMELKE